MKDQRFEIKEHHKINTHIGAVLFQNLQVKRWNTISLVCQSL